jgi:cystathionine beta-lyase/cystathionine gamma-synthase
LKDQFQTLDTTVIHGGELDENAEGAITLPIFQSSTFLYSGQSRYEDLKYIRLNNTPNHRVLHAKLAALEGGEDALVTGSGMAAISATLLTLLSSGDHLLAQDCLYGGTHDLLTKDFCAWGIEYDFINTSDPGSWEALLRPETKAVLIEGISNPLMKIGDLGAVVAFAKANGLVSLIDNTFATPINFKPLAHGFDLVLHSCTKYLNGHSDIVAGAVIGSRVLIRKINRRLLHLGGSLDPHACFLLHRGLKTLAVRVRQHNHNALELARFLEGHPAVSRVNYPGLENGFSNVEDLDRFQGFGGMISFELSGGADAAREFVSMLELAQEAPSLGGVETLITRPVTTSHSGLSSEDREQLGITDGLLRVSVGIEGIEDLIDDFAQALARISQS